MKPVHLANLDLNLLVVLDDLLRTGSTTETASRLGRTQSAVSHALGRLRATMGDPLFVRAGATLRPTALAEQMAAPLADVIAGADALLRRSGPAFDPARLSRTFVVAGTDFIELLALPHLLPLLRREAPDVDVQTRVLGDDVERSIAARDVDVAVGTRFRALAGIHESKVFDDRFVVLLREGHPATRRLSLATYLALDHTVVTPRGRPGSIIDDCLAQLGAGRRRVVLRLPHFVSAALLVSRTDLVVTAPSAFAHAMTRLAPLTVSPLPFDVPDFTFSMIFGAHTARDPGQRWFRDKLADALREGLPPQTPRRRGPRR